MVKVGHFSTSNNLWYEKEQNDFKLKKYRFMALTKSTIESKVQLLLKKLLWLAMMTNTQYICPYNIPNVTLCSFLNHILLKLFCLLNKRTVTLFISILSSNTKNNDCHLLIKNYKKRFLHLHHYWHYSSFLSFFIFCHVNKNLWDSIKTLLLMLMVAAAFATSTSATTNTVVVFLANEKRGQYSRSSSSNSNLFDF